MRILAGFIAALMLVAGAAAAFVWFGVFSVAATKQHSWPVYWITDITMRRSVKKRAENIQVPPLTDAAMINRGFALFEQHCVQCHGAPGVAPASFALGLLPAPANLAYTVREWSTQELFWVIKHGIKAAGMPAWEFRLAEDDIWAIVAFMTQLPRIAPLDYKQMRAAKSASADKAERVDPSPGVDVDRGITAIHQYACGTCHSIPNIVGAYATVGPPLAGIGNRAFIGGVIANTPDNMVRWLRDPQAIDPRSGMPNLHITERDARDIAAYLYTLKH